MSFILQKEKHMMIVYSKYKKLVGGTKSEMKKREAVSKVKATLTQEEVTTEKAQAHEKF